MKRTTKALTSAMLGLLSLISAAPLAAAEPPTIKESPIFGEFESRWKDALTSVGAPGFAVVVVKDGKIILLDGMGVRDVDTKKPVTPDTMFYIASMTKTYNAMAALALADDGKLDLDAPVKRYLPQLELSDPDLTETLTVRDLMCHRYGINNSAIVFNDAYTGLITDDLYFRLLKDATIAHEPDYTNVHFTLLGRVIQAVSGKHWRDYLEERIFKPAGMTRTTGYASRMYGDANCAYPHVWYGDAFHRTPVMKTDRTMHAAGGLGTTARDLGRWLILNMQRGQIDGKQIVTKARVEDMLEMHAQLPKPSGKIRVRQGFGLGWGLGTYRGRPYAFHGGGYVGTAAYMSFLTEGNIGMGILVNCDYTGQGICDVVSVDIYDKLLGLDEGDLLPAYQKMGAKFRSEGPKPPDGENPAKSGKLSLPPERYVGQYTADIWGTIDVSLEDGQLHMAIGDMKLQLYSNGDDAFEAMLSPGEVYSGSFEVADDKVMAIAVKMDDESNTRFVRR